jgi:hypothetical protein
MATIYSPSGEVQRRNATVTVSSETRQPPKTEYVYVGNDREAGWKPKVTGRRLTNWPQQGQTQTPRYVPRAMGNAQMIGYAWLVAMILVGFDEWKNNGILPRPVRLWDTSIVYGLLALAAIIPPLIPLANALAVGYTIVLLWQYYNGQGQFNNG